MSGVHTHIKSRGELRMDEFMHLALMHPEFGYYQTREVFGAKGDFITAPEISQIFGELCGIWAADCWLQSGRPKATWMELGPGRGTLMRDALRATKSVAGFHEQISVRMVEASAMLQAIQRDTLADSNVNIVWMESIEQLPKTPLFVIANEFFDALPIRQFVKQQGAWFERYVAWNAQNAQLEFVLKTHAQHFFDKNNADFFEHSVDSQKIMTVLCKHVKTYGGAILAIDYGYEGGSRIDTLQAVRSHAYADVLQHAGCADITAHVDFDALREIANAHALTSRIAPQGEFLLRMGAQQRAEILCKHVNAQQQEMIVSALKRLVSPDEMGTLFKVLACSHPSIHIAGFTP